MESRFQSDSEVGHRNRAANEDLFALALREREEVFKKGRTVPKGSNRLSVYQRIESLRDKGSDVLYLSVTAGRGMPYGTVNSAGSIVAIAEIVGETCIIMGNDWTFKGGTIYPVTLKKQLRAQEIAMENRLPSIALVDSGGAFLPLQVNLGRAGYLICMILMYTTHLGLFGRVGLHYSYMFAAIPSLRWSKTYGYRHANHSKWR